MYTLSESNDVILLYDVEIPGGGGSSSSPEISNGSEYVVWDPTIIKGGLENMKETVGTAFNVGIWVFLIISGIYIATTIVRSLFG